METRWMFICFVLLPLSASQSCPDESDCSSGTGTLPDTQSSFGNDSGTLSVTQSSFGNDSGTLSVTQSSFGNDSGTLPDTQSSFGNDSGTLTYTQSSFGNFSGTLPDTQSSSGNDSHILDLSFKLITVLPPDFFNQQDVTNVTSLHLNDNSIKDLLPESFKPVVALRHLYLQNNQISKIHPNAFQSNVHLITLDLSGNKLQELDPIIFQKSLNLLWVNITGNPLNASAVQATLFNLSLNTIDTDTCNNTENSINSFEAIPYLRGLNLKENSTFTVGNLTSYQSIKVEEMSLKNYAYHKLLKSGYNHSSELRYDGIQKVILGPTNTSFMCFCDRLSAWFWCFERPLPCPGHSADTYSLLKCNVTPTETPLPHTSSPSPALSPALSTKPSTEAAKTDGTTNFATDTSTSNTYQEQKTADYDITLYVALGSVIGGVMIVSIISSVVIIVVWSRRKKNVTEQRVRYTSVSRDDSDPSSFVTYYNPHDKLGYNAESNIYATPYAHNQYTTFRPQPTISARADNIRRIPSEYD